MTFYTSPITNSYPHISETQSALKSIKITILNRLANKNYTAKKGIKNIFVSNYIIQSVKYTANSIAYPIHFHKRKDLYAVRKFFNNSGNNKRHKNELKAKNLNTKFKNKSKVNG